MSKCAYPNGFLAIIKASLFSWNLPGILKISEIMITVLNDLSLYFLCDHRVSAMRNLFSSIITIFLVLQSKWSLQFWFQTNYPSGDLKACAIILTPISSQNRRCYIIVFVGRVHAFLFMVLTSEMFWAKFSLKNYHLRQKKGKVTVDISLQWYRSEKNEREQLYLCQPKTDADSSALK